MDHISFLKWNNFHHFYTCVSQNQISQRAPLTMQMLCKYNCVLSVNLCYIHFISRSNGTY